MSPAIRVFLADDQALVRSGFRMILSSYDGIEVVGEAANGAEAVALAASLAPDVICMDVEMPEMNGIRMSVSSRSGSSRSTSSSASSPLLALPTRWKPSASQGIIVQTASRSSSSSSATTAPSSTTSPPRSLPLKAKAACASIRAAIPTG